MKPYPFIATLIIYTFLITSSCTSQNSTTNNKEIPTATSDSDISVHLETENTDSAFPLPTVPTMITNPDDIKVYLSAHYWDRFNFADTTLIRQPEITEQGFADYIQLINQLPSDHATKSIHIMLDKAKQHSSMYTHFAKLYEKYFYDPNSPFRNEELYTPALKHFTESGKLPSDLQYIFDFQYKMIQKNRVGSTATNFAYTLANGQKKMMHDIASNYLILFFTNPNCPSCRSTTDQLSNSPVLHEVFARNTATYTELTVLSIFPDTNVDEWRKALPTLPKKNWINSFDDGEIIYNKHLYDIKAIPTLYLLDKDKKVVLKDVTLMEIEEYFINNL